MGGRVVFDQAQVCASAERGLIGRAAPNRSRNGRHEDAHGESQAKQRHQPHVLPRHPADATQRQEQCWHGTVGQCRQDRGQRRQQARGDERTRDDENGRRQHDQRVLRKRCLLVACHEWPLARDHPVAIQ